MKNLNTKKTDLGNKKILAKNLQRLMKARGVDRNKLCADLGYSYTTLTEWVKGNAYPRIDKIEALANYFNVPKSHLIESQDVINSLNAKKAKMAIDALTQIATGHEAMGGDQLLTIKFAAELLSKTLIRYLKSDNSEDLIKLAAILRFADKNKLDNLKEFIINQYYDETIDSKFKKRAKHKLKS